MTLEEMLALKAQMAQREPKPWELPQGGAMPPQFTAPNEAPAVGAMPPPAQPGDEAAMLAEMLAKRNQMLAPAGQAVSGTPAPLPAPEPSMLDMVLKRFGFGK